MIQFHGEMTITVWNELLAAIIDQKKRLLREQENAYSTPAKAMLAARILYLKTAAETLAQNATEIKYPKAERMREEWRAEDEARKAATNSAREEKRIRGTNENFGGTNATN